MAGENDSKVQASNVAITDFSDVRINLHNEFIQNATPNAVLSTLTGTLVGISLKKYNDQFGAEHYSLILTGESNSLGLKGVFPYELKIPEEQYDQLESLYAKAKESGKKGMPLATLLYNEIKEAEKTVAAILPAGSAQWERLHEAVYPDKVHDEKKVAAKRR